MHPENVKALLIVGLVLLVLFGVIGCQVTVVPQ
jgi:hypothetical protein